MTTSFVSGHERHNNKKHDEIHGTTIETSCCVGHAAGDNHSADCKETFLNDFNALLDADETDSLKSSVSPQMNIGNLLENNKRWVQKKTQEDPEFFRRQATLHKPEYLFIGCSDARLSVQHMLGLEMGQLFVHRNVANQVVNTDLNFVTCLTYAVDVLKVKNIIICGHYDCGGVRAAMRNHDHGIIEQWIMGIRDVARYHKNELRDIKDPDLIHRRLVELNVQEQALKLYASPVVQRSQAQHGIPQIHALVFDVGEGYLKELSVDFKKIIKKYKDVYSMYNFADQKNEKST
jgi:carbonic anhydrase